jgi:hypothetical protein
MPGRGSHYWIFSKDPSVQAFTDLMNRALDNHSATRAPSPLRSRRLHYFSTNREEFRGIPRTAGECD